MGASGFRFEMDESGKLAWAWPPNIPDVTDDQARTLALCSLAAAIEKLADAISTRSDAS